MAGCAVEPSALSLAWLGAPWVQDQAGSWYLLDTGAPRSLFRPSVVGGSPGEGPAPNWQVTGWPSPRSDVVWTEVLPDALGAVEASGALAPVGGLVGMDQLLGHTWTFDAPELRVDVDRAPPSDPWFEMKMLRTGGGNACAGGVCYDWGRHRALVTLMVAQTPATLLLDTGATHVVLDPGFMQQAGLAITDHELEGQTFRVAGASVASDGVDLGHVAVTVADEDLVVDLAQLSVEVGIWVDGLLGQSFLEGYVTEVDLRRDRLRLYTSRWDRLPPAWVHPGLWLQDDGADCWTVQMLTRDGPAAAAGIQLGDCVEQVDAFRPADRSGLEVFEHFEAQGAGAITVLVVDDQPLELDIVDWLR